MAVVDGTVLSTEILKGEARDPLQFEILYFSLSGTYAQADNARLVDVASVIKNARRDGKTPTIRSAALWQPARKSSNPALLMGLKTIVIASSVNLTFEVTESATEGSLDITTESADATALPAQEFPFGILVGFTTN